MMKHAAVAMSLALAVLAQFSAAQSAPGRLTGVVTDSGGAVVPGVEVEATSEDSGAAYTSRTDSNGAYSLNVPEGRYTVEFALAGFENVERNGVAVSAGAPTRLDVVLGVKSVEESITVAALPREAMQRLQSLGYVAGYEGVPSGFSGSATPDFVTEEYARIDELGFRDPSRQPLSTFSVDVDTASYANVRRFLSSGEFPPRDAVRIEEFVNYFSYDYPTPAGEAPFSVTSEVAACPWSPTHRLVSIGLRGRPMPEGELPPRNLVFLLDVSGSMGMPSKLPLLKRSMGLLVRHLTSRDRVAIVVYAGASGLVLPSTPGSEADEILAALGRLEAGGSTHGSAGIQQAYAVAQENHIEGGVNRVILATDGDFNIGITDAGALTRLIEEKRASGIFLSVLGFGTGNLADNRMESLADRGNGNFAYIDSIHEARKVLVSEAGGTLVTIAKDVKIQVEFNPARVAAYRLIGYENRMLADEDFADDAKDAGEIGADHRVTALYEIVQVGTEIDLPGVSDLKYQERPALSPDATGSDELLTVKLRYKPPEADQSRLISVALRDEGASDPASANLGFAAAVAEFALLLRDSEFKGEASYSQVLELARRHRGDDLHGYRGEFIRLVELARELAPPTTPGQDR
jgi:Ca-activated chloride channel family protein